MKFKNKVGINLMYFTLSFILIPLFFVNIFFINFAASNKQLDIESNLNSNVYYKFDSETKLNFNKDDYDFIYTNDLMILYSKSNNLWYEFNYWNKTLISLNELNESNYTYDDFLWVNTIESGKTYLQFSTQPMSYDSSDLNGINVESNTYSYFDITPTSKNFNKFVTYDNSIFTSNNVSTSIHSELWNYLFPEWYRLDDIIYMNDFNSDIVSYSFVSLVNTAQYSRLHPNGNVDNLKNFTYSENSMDEEGYHPQKNELYYETSWRGNKGLTEIKPIPFNKKYPPLYFNYLYYGSEGMILQLNDPNSEVSYDDSYFYINFKDALSYQNNNHLLTAKIPKIDLINNLNISNTRYISQDVLLQTIAPGSYKIIQMDTNIESIINYEDYSVSINTWDTSNIYENSRYFFWDYGNFFYFLDKETNEINSFEYPFDKSEIKNIASTSNGNLILTLKNNESYLFKINLVDGNYSYSLLDIGTVEGEILFYTNGLFLVENNNAVTVKPLFMIDITNYNYQKLTFYDDDYLIDSQSDNLCFIFDDYINIKISQTFEMSEGPIYISSVSFNSINISEKIIEESNQSSLVWEINTQYLIDNSQSKTKNNLSITLKEQSDNTTFAISYDFFIIKNHLPDLKITTNNQNSKSLELVVIQEIETNKLMEGIYLEKNDTFELNIFDTSLVKNIQVYYNDGNFYTYSVEQINDKTFYASDVDYFVINDIFNQDWVIKIVLNEEQTNYSRYWTETATGSKEYEQAISMGISENNLQAMNYRKIQEMESILSNAVSINDLVINEKIFLGAILEWNNNSYLNNNEFTLSTEQNDIKLSTTLEQVFISEINEFYQTTNPDFQTDLKLNQDFKIEWNISSNTPISLTSQTDPLSITFISLNYDLIYGMKTFTVISSDSLGFISLTELELERIDRLNNSQPIDSISKSIDKNINNLIQQNISEENNVYDIELYNQLIQTINVCLSNYLINSNYIKTLESSYQLYFQNDATLNFSLDPSFYQNTISIDAYSQNHHELDYGSTLDDIYEFKIKISPNLKTSYFSGFYSQTILNQINQPLLPTWLLILLIIISTLIIILLVFVFFRYKNKLKSSKLKKQLLKNSMINNSEMTNHPLSNHVLSEKIVQGNQNNFQIDNKSEKIQDYFDLNDLY